ncbi:hypothetical protein [Leisingera sp. JC1]|uniref:hypothetical protein n=1 Tax=Leisingera sp. JC1 TaxID=1855282 RepID=UPI000803A2C0|nr:hypothetical protein [Leisingera sp. JC1]OBY27194.1 hypothetical protein A9D60_02250 [Leisingera sp. JC1]
MKVVPVVLAISAIPIAWLGVSFFIERAASCPTSEDLARGIVFEEELAKDHGYIVKSHRKASDNDTITASYFLTDGKLERLFESFNETASAIDKDITPATTATWITKKSNGLYNLLQQQAEGSNRTSYEYSIIPTELVLSYPDDEVFYTVQWFRDNKTWLRETRSRVTKRGFVHFGSCTYGALQIENNGYRTSPEGVKKREKQLLVYIPELLYSLRGLLSESRPIKVRHRQDGDFFPDAIE